jgi:hypothetical protein
VSPDPWDADLLAVHNAVDNLGPWLAIWQARREPDAHARRCASDAIAALDELVAAAYRIRGRLVGEVVEADRATAIRVDALLTRTGAPPGHVRDGPAAKAGPPALRDPDAAQGAEAMPCHQATPGPRHGGDPS